MGFRELLEDVHARGPAAEAVSEEAAGCAEQGRCHISEWLLPSPLIGREAGREHGGNLATGTTEAAALRTLYGGEASTLLCHAPLWS